MRNDPTNLNAEFRETLESLFTSSIRRRNKLARIEALVGGALHLNALEISAGDGVISSRLRGLGGSWKTAARRPEAVEALSHSLNETITLLEEEKLPYEDASFDRLVIVDALRYFADDHAFLRECHRVLKNDGWVIISETRRAPASIVGLLKRLFGRQTKEPGAARKGYAIAELFDKLKDGFDVPETIIYSNTLFEGLAAGVEAGRGPEPPWLLNANAGPVELAKIRGIIRRARIAFPLSWLLSKFEFLPGHALLVKSRRRHWRPRLQPKLIDGRSIAEAAINTKIGTAAPF